ncbi:MAG: hypothetical protein GSR80_001796 [Desulfurococcales archaeon]|nr:hypothetical protein [Desulfurococcales archaeon]
MGTQIKLFIALASAATLSAIVSGWLHCSTCFYSSLAFLLATPYLASLLVYLRERGRTSS